MDSPYLTASEVARYLRVDTATVRRWCTDGTLPTLRAGRGFRIHRDDLVRMTGRPLEVKP